MTDYSDLISAYRRNKKLYELFLNSVQSDFISDMSLNYGIPTVIHSTKIRMKDEDHLIEKIKRKNDLGRVITSENLFKEITDLAGLRILHLHQNQFEKIHQFINKKIKLKQWKLLEKPVAYTWDPESVDFFKQFNLKTALKPSYYTSVHYLIAPCNETETVNCEVQVRTLFEEAWGEIDHSINYPNATSDFATQEQLRVLSRLVGTGSRLADSIFKVHEKNGMKGEIKI